MKVGNLTYHNTTNYGAILQTYALQKSILNLGFDCEVINYVNETLKSRYEVKKILKLNSLKQIILAILLNPINKELLSSFSEFMSKMIKLSSQTYTKENITESNLIYDKFIVGSDQVWNLNLNGDDLTYFLDFVNDNKKKYAYAASFGYDKIPLHRRMIIKEVLSEFNSISVREEQGQKILLEEKIESKVVLDPTFLIGPEEWNEIIKDNISKESYILLYIVTPTPTIIDFVRKLKKKTGLKVIHINHSYNTVLGVKTIRGIGPEEFLWYIKNAKYVVTTSFHGIALSINFNKNFFYELSGQKSNYNSRIITTVRKFGLESRNIQNVNLDKEYEINFDIVNEILTDERQKSIQYLKSILLDNKKGSKNE